MRIAFTCMMARGCMTSIGKANQLVLVEPESFDGRADGLSINSSWT